MAGTASKDCAVGDGSSASEGMSMGQNCQAGDLLAEWRSCEQVDNDTPSTSPPYWDTDDEDDNGPKPSELYGKFTWKIENFSQISKRELRSNAFEVGGYKWYILIYPQGCDVCNHLSLFLCVANHDRLLPGWSHFAQFTIAVVNKDPKKSKYSDTLHRFWKKEHDWGWKKFMELSKIVDGFIDADTLVIKAQVQVIREKANRPFRCLDRQYRRELVRVYLSNVENICRRFIEERRGMLSKLIEDRVSWSGFRLFWLGVDQNARRRMSRDKTDAILKVIVKHFFVEKEVTSTLVMDSLYSGLKALEWQSENKRGTNKSADIDEMPTPIVDVENGIFFLADDALVLLERTALEPLPPKDDKGSQNQSQSQNQNQNRTKDGNSTEEFSKDSVERDEKRLTELGRRTLEIFVLTHIFSSKIEVAYQEVVAFQRQEELIREEEAAEQAELEIRAKRIAAEKEKRAKKKLSKQKRNNRKGKEKDMPTKANLISADIILKSNSPDQKILEDFSAKSEEIVSEKIEVVEDASDMSDTGVDTFSIDRGFDDRVSSPRNWETVGSTCSAINTGAEASSSEVQNDQLGKKGRSALDDSSSTCSTDSIPSVVSNTTNRVSLSQNKDVPPNSRGRNRRNKATRRRSSQTSHDTVILPSDVTLDAGHVQDTTYHSRTSTPEREAILPSNGHAQLPQLDIPDKKERNPCFEDKQQAKDPVTESTQQPRKVDSSPSTIRSKNTPISQQLKRNSEVDSAESLSTRESRADVERQVERVVPVILKSRKNANVEKPEIQKLPNSGKVMNSTGASPVSRPLSAPLIPEAKPTVPIVSTVQTSPLISRSASAFGRLGATESPSSSQSYAPLSYRNAIIGKSTSWSNSSGYAPDPSSSNRGSLYSQPAASVVTASRTDSVRSGAEQPSMRPGLTFGSVAPKPSVSGNRAPAGHFVHESAARSIHHPAFTRNAAGSSYSEELVSEQAARQAQCNTADEFPHLDIINYVLDEDYMDANMSATGRSSLHNWQYGFPGNLAGAEAGPSNVPCHFNGPDQYYGDTNGMYDLYHLDGGRDLLSLDVDSPAYSSSEMDGWMGANQWHPGAAPNSLLNVGSSTECSPLPYQLQDYSNLACGVSGYTMYPPTNGF